MDMISTKPEMIPASGFFPPQFKKGHIMKTHLKSIFAAGAVMAAVSGSFVLAQTAPTVATASPAEGSATGRGGERGGLRGGMRGGRQPHMELSIALLRQARNQLDAAKPDKGGFREKAIASVDLAIKDVQAGIDYAADHPEEFGPAGRGPRGTGLRGGREGGTGEPGTTPSAGGAPTIAPPTIAVPAVGG